VLRPSGRCGEDHRVLVDHEITRLINNKGAPYVARGAKEAWIRESALDCIVLGGWHLYHKPRTARERVAILLALLHAGEVLGGCRGRHVLTRAAVPAIDPRWRRRRCGRWRLLGLEQPSCSGRDAVGHDVACDCLKRSRANQVSVCISSCVGTLKCDIRAAQRVGHSNLFWLNRVVARSAENEVLHLGRSGRLGDVHVAVVVEVNAPWRLVGVGGQWTERSAKGGAASGVILLVVCTCIHCTVLPHRHLWPGLM